MGIKNEMRWADLHSGEQKRFIKNLCSYECAVKGKTTFNEEFVTGGFNFHHALTNGYVAANTIAKKSK